MFEFVPLPLVDDFLLNVNIGDAIFALFALSLLAAIPLKSRKVLSMNAIMFGILFLLVVSMGAPTMYAYLGVALLVVAPLLFTTAGR